MNTEATTIDRELLNAVIASRGIHPVFQPIVDTEEGRIHAFEALSRPAVELGFRTPSELFHAAQSAGMLWELEIVARRRAFEAARNWPSERQLFINSSPSVVTDKRFVHELLKEVQEVGLSPERVVVEITELSDDSVSSDLVARSQSLKSAGFMVAVDDAGAGTSGLNRIAQIRPLWIKLDLQFVRKIHTDKFRQNLVRFLVHFARLSNINLVAEGIETAEELETIIRLGVRFAQGYFLSRPASLDIIRREDYEEDVRRKLRTINNQFGHSNRQAASIGRLVEECACIEHTGTLSQATRILGTKPQIPGIVAMDGHRAVGWIWRSHVDQAVRTAHHGIRVGDLMNAHLVRVPANTSLQEALDVACVFEDQPPADPILIIEDGEVKGIVRLRELIRVATREGRVGFSTNGALTDLPTRVQADQHLMEQISGWKNESDEKEGLLHSDAAIVDIRQFAEYNAIFGYTVGDRLIQVVADLLEVEVRSRIPGCFTAHLGTDRFLVTAGVDQIGPRLVELMERFDDLMRGWNAEATQRKDDATKLAVPGLRVLMMDGILKEIEHPREVYRREMELRSKAHSRERVKNPQGSEMIHQECAVGTVKHDELQVDHNAA